jgi:hypothetical protein
MNTTFQVILGALMVAAVHDPGFAADTGTMMCKGGIVSIGATAGEVTSKCGQPASTTQSEEKRVTNDSRSSRDKTITSVSIDDWIFNFGPNQFQYRVIFENGMVARIESLDYGY